MKLYVIDDDCCMTIYDSEEEFCEHFHIKSYEAFENGVERIYFMDFDDAESALCYVQDEFSSEDYSEDIFYRETVDVLKKEMGIDYSVREVQYKSYLNNRMNATARWIEIDGRDYDFEDVMMSDRGEIKLWNDDESFSLYPVYSPEEDIDGNYRVIGYRREEEK